MKDANGGVLANLPLHDLQRACAHLPGGQLGEVGVALNSPAMTVNGGTAPYTFSVIGTLPAGLTLNTTTGAITGTPTASGTFTIQVKDAKGAVAAAPAPSPSPAALAHLPGGQLGRSRRGAEQPRHDRQRRNLALHLLSGRDSSQRPDAEHHHRRHYRNPHRFRNL